MMHTAWCRAFSCLTAAQPAANWMLIAKADFRYGIIGSQSSAHFRRHSRQLNLSPAVSRTAKKRFSESEKTPVSFSASSSFALGLGSAGARGDTR